jgi:DNA-binding IclR family transcriptional regulator
MTIREFSLPVMREIQKAIGETVILNIRVGNTRVSLETIESTQSIQRDARPRHDSPLYAGATGRVVLAGMDAGEVRKYLFSARLEKLTSETMTDPEAILEQIHQIREIGYATSSGEINMGISAVAAPIQDRSGKTAAVLSISYPKRRQTAKLRERSVRCVVEGARHISRQLRAIP